MSAKPCVEYEIVLQDGTTRSVVGYPIAFPLRGDYAVRRVRPDNEPTDEFLVVDHIDTGFRVASGDTRDEAITAALALAEKEGEAGFQRAIAGAQARQSALRAKAS